jgi:hypothetical protein
MRLFTIKVSLKLNLILRDAVITISATICLKIAWYVMSALRLLSTTLCPSISLHYAFIMSWKVNHLICVCAEHVGASARKNEKCVSRSPVQKNKWTQISVNYVRFFNGVSVLIINNKRSKDAGAFWWFLVRGCVLWTGASQIARRVCVDL